MDKKTDNGTESVEDSPHTARQEQTILLQTLPMVIPQLTHSRLKGPFGSPIVRAYPAALEAHGISKEDFAIFLDGFNEAFVVNPAFVATSFVGQVLEMFYGVHIVQFVGIGVKVGSIAASAAVSWARSHAYVKAMNANLFHPHGLEAHVIGTKTMAQRISYPSERLHVLPEEHNADGKDDESSGPQQAQGPNDTMRDRMKPLEGYVSPLDYSLPDSVSSDNLFKRLGEWNASRMHRSQSASQSKRRIKHASKAQKKEVKVAKKEGKMNRKIDKAETKFAIKKAKAEAEMAAGAPAKAQAILDKAEEKRDKKVARATEKGERKMAKKTIKVERKQGKTQKREEAKANKVRWMVIMPWDGEEIKKEEEEDFDYDDDSEEASDGWHVENLSDEGSSGSGEILFEYEGELPPPYEEVKKS